MVLPCFSASLSTCSLNPYLLRIKKNLALIIDIIYMYYFNFRNAARRNVKYWFKKHIIYCRLEQLFFRALPTSWAHRKLDGARQTICLLLYLVLSPFVTQCASPTWTVLLTLGTACLLSYCCGPTVSCTRDVCS